MTPQTRRVFLSSAGSAAVLAACGQSTTTQSNQLAAHPGEMVFNRGNAAEPLSLDPHHVQGNYEFNVVGDLLMGLTNEDAACNPIPGAAVRWEQSEDGNS